MKTKFKAQVHPVETELSEDLNIDHDAKKLRHVDRDISTMAAYVYSKNITMTILWLLIAYFLHEVYGVFGVFSIT